MELRTVEMLRTVEGLLDGDEWQPFIEGEVYELPYTLAVIFVEKHQVARYVQRIHKPVATEFRNDTPT